MKERTPQGTWQPIETAPKNGKFFCYMDGCPVVASWDNNRFAKNPRPYFTCDLERIFGILWARGNQPTHWMPLPKPPNYNEGR